jgi:c-di-GMP-binding flagellar brake protein YcgR
MLDGDWSSDVCSSDLLDNNSHVRRFGCQFTNVDGTAMNLIQRYIIRIERDRRAKETGLV